MTTSAFPGLSAAEQAFKDILWDPMIKAGETWIAGAEASVPILDLAPIQSLEDDAIEAVTNLIFKQILLMIDVAAIKLVNTAAQSAYDSAFETLSIIGSEKGKDSPEYVKAKQDALSALSRFTQLHTG